MTVDRALFETHFKHLPPWECPSCSKGHFELISPTLKMEETWLSRASRQHDAWEPNWIDKRFMAHLQCNFKACGEVCVIAGRTSVEITSDIDEKFDLVEVAIDIFHPEFLSPAPMPIRIPANAPGDVGLALLDAASLLWQSAEAAANHVRRAVEHLLDSQKVPRYAVKPGKRTRLPLHDRIVAFAKLDAANADILFAVKWLGNSGSHAEALTRDDVLDAFDMIEHVLTNLYDTTTKEMLKKVKAVNKARGPAKKK